MSSEIKDVLSTLCRCVNSLVDATLTPDHLRLAKYNSSDESGTEMLLKTLHVLSYHAAREKCADVDFRNYDTLSAVKLHLAFLQYPAIEFYGRSRSDNQNRVPLIALAWLLGTQDVLRAALRAKLIDGPLGAECWRPANTVDPPKSTSSSDDVKRNDQSLSTLGAQLDNILHLNGRVNQNLKQIAELISQWAGLASKVHAASVDYFGPRRTTAPESPPHLSVSELALTKRLATLGECSAEDRRRLRELRDATAVLDAHAKWSDKRHVFFDWMTTVVQEHRRSMERDAIAINSRELATFVSLLRRVLGDELRARTQQSGKTASEPRDLARNCTSRVQRCNDTEEARKRLDDLNERQRAEEESLRQNSDRLADELKEMLRQIPSAIRV